MVPIFSFVLPPVRQGPERLRLYEEAVAVPSEEARAVADAARKRGTVIVPGGNERGHGLLCRTQLIFDADGSLKFKRCKITPTYHEGMIWGQGDGAGLKAVETAVGRVGALAWAAARSAGIPAARMTNSWRKVPAAPSVSFAPQFLVFRECRAGAALAATDLDIL